MSSGLTVINSPVGRSIISFLNPVSATRTLIRNRELIGQLALRDISQRYRGSTLGAAWPFLQPLLLLAVYTLVFAGVFKAHWPTLPEGDTTGFALVVFTGLITFNIFSECVLAAPRLVIQNVNFVKRVSFPLEVLPIAKVLAAVIQGVISLPILFVGMLLLGWHLTWTTLLFPLIWIPFALITLGATFFLASMGVFLRDLDQVIGVFVTGLFFGSAIFYPLTRVPEAARMYIEWLPTALAIEQTRQVILFDTVPPWQELGIAASIGVAVCLAGYACFMKSKRAFADVM